MPACISTVWENLDALLCCLANLNNILKNGATCKLSKKYKKSYCSFCQISLNGNTSKTKSIIIDILSELLQVWQRAFISPNRTCSSTFLDTFNFSLPTHPLNTSLFSPYIACHSETQSSPKPYSMKLFDNAVFSQWNSKKILLGFRMFQEFRLVFIAV